MREAGQPGRRRSGGTGPTAQVPVRSRSQNSAREAAPGKRPAIPTTASGSAQSPAGTVGAGAGVGAGGSEEHTSELQSRENLVCRPLLENKKIEQGSRQVSLSC